MCWICYSQWIDWLYNVHSLLPPSEPYSCIKLEFMKKKDPRPIYEIYTERESVPLSYFISGWGGGKFRSWAWRGGGHKGAWGRGVEGENGVELPGYIFVSLLFSILFPFFPFFFLWTNYYIFYVEWFFFFPVSRPPTSTSPHTLLLLGFTVYCAYCGGILISPTWSFAVGVCCAVLVYFREKLIFLFCFNFDCVWYGIFQQKFLFFQP